VITPTSADGATVVLVTGARAADPPAGLERVAGRVDLAFADTADEVAAGIGPAEVVFAWRPDRALLERNLQRARRLRWIQSASAGVDRLLFPALVDADVIVTNARGVFDDAIGEYVLACILIFAKDLATTIRDSRERRWRYRNTEALAGRTVLVLGAGPIGTAVGERASSLGMRVDAVASAARPATWPYDRVRGVDELLHALSDADVVVNALPLTDATRHLLDQRAFDAMRRSAWLVNVGRGETVDEAALVDALDRGRIAAAALDVFETEPLPASSRLWDMPNVIVSPHMSGDVVGWEGRVVDVFIENLERWLRGEPLHNIVDKSRGFVPTAAAGEPGRLP
jgi:phosphoglycerate dehydrogenase-like enzyme